MGIDKNIFWKKIVKTASDCHGDHNTFWKKIKQLRGHNHNDPPYLLHNNTKFTDKKEQTQIMSETWENTFRIARNNANWANMMKVNNWINNNNSKTQPYIKSSLNRLYADNPLISLISVDDVKMFIKKMKKKAPGESQIGHQIIK